MGPHSMDKIMAKKSILLTLGWYAAGERKGKPGVYTTRLILLKNERILPLYPGDGVSDQVAANDCALHVGTCRHFVQFGLGV